MTINYNMRRFGLKVQYMMRMLRCCMRVSDAEMESSLL